MFTLVYGSGHNSVVYYMYVLRSQQTGRLYIGYTTNLKQRLHQHLTGDVHTSRRMGKISLIFYEAFLQKEDAKRRERYFKTTKGKRSLKIMLKDSLKVISE